MNKLILLFISSLILASCMQKKTAAPKPKDPTVTKSEMWDGIKQFGVVLEENTTSSITHDSSGNLYYASTVYISNGLTPPALVLKHELHLSKVSSVGKIIWEKKYTLGGFNMFFMENKSLYVDSSENIYFNFSASGTLNSTDATIGDIQSYLGKLDKNGNQIWLKNTCPAGATCMAYAIAADNNGIFTAGVLSNGNVEDPALPYANQDGFVLKYDASGNKTWAKQFTVPAGDMMITGLVTDSTPNLYVLANEVRLDSGTNGAVYKFDASGTQLWKNSVGTAASTLEYSSAVVLGGNVYAVGNAHGTVGGQTTVGLSDGALVKISATGVTSFVKTFGNNSSTTFNFHSIVDDGTSLYVAGDGDGPFVGFSPLGYSDAFIIKFDTTGAKKWLRQVGDSDASVVQAGLDFYRDSATGTGLLFLAGTTNSGLEDNTQRGTLDAFLAKFDVTGERY
jgi:hypothetical protein